ncbi:glutathione S-transferase [Metarhizium acridum CQMa 102]|uniref:Glutathione S-transferase n=1 Tax=Metarhizium acridum (strain CQMa 102) TaxID=655827 RepID=E9E6T3_METAQ|nr:glutathione S-transferase [Metarhizium acridum CQMa 102]EFY88372.1 glutathione S-transferase [Metarhizium acridum CQMa 102]
MCTPESNHQLTVFRGSPPKNAYVWSPFVTKLEARLRFSGVPYRLGGGSPRSAPRGKIPYVEVAGPGPGGEPRTMGDSTLIIRSLVEAGALPDAVAGWLARRAVSSGLYQQGTARLTDDEVRLLKEEAWDSLNALLTESVKTSSRQRSKTNDDDAPFWVLGGYEPTEADATVYGFIAGALVCTA